MGEETVFVQFRENKYGIFNLGLQELHATLLEILVQNPESQSTGAIFFNQGMRFAIIPFSFHYYSFDKHSRDKIGQASENGSSVLLRFLTIEHVLNFITTTYLVNSELQHVYENQFVFLPEIEMSLRRRTLRRFRQGYRNIFPYKDYASPQVKKQKIVENDNDQNCENFQTTRQTEYLLCIKKFHEKVKMGPFYVCVICNRCLYFSNVIKFDLEKYDRESVNKLNTNVTCFDGNYYILKPVILIL